MARSFTQSLLAAAVAVVVGGSALAQDSSLKEAVTLIRLGKADDAKAMLRNILTADPSNADALKLYQSVSQDEWFMMLTGSDQEIRQIAQSILDRAKSERKERSRDEAAIKDLVAEATGRGDHGVRQAAINKLITMHGEFAVPALVEKLSDADDAEGQIQAIYTLSQLHSVAVLPLIEVLKSDKELTVQNAAAALHHIGDDRAIPAMANLANDSRVGVSTIAKTFLAKKGVKGSALDLMLGQAGQYLRGNVPIGGFSEVVWRLVDNKLQATDVNPLVYATELAKACAADAVGIAPQSAEAISMLAQANLAEASLIQGSLAQGDDAMKALEPMVAELKIAALATGLKSLRSALDAGMSLGNAPVAMGAIDALGTAESADSISGSSLVRALDSTDKRVSYAAAQALVRATGGVNVPASDRVVAVLAEAVAEEAVRTIQVIDPAQEAKAAAKAANAGRGEVVVQDASAVGGMRNILNNPNVDVVVINEILPDGLPEDVIGNIHKDSRMANTKVVIIAKDVEAAKTRFGDTVQGVVQAPLTGEALVTEVSRVLEGSANPVGARAEAYAKGASEALFAVAAKGSIEGALKNLALQLNRGDDVAVPAARALGLGGGAGQFDALVAALSSSSAAVKLAAAEAIGHILSRTDGCPASVADALIGVVSGDGEVALRTAAAVALGKAKLDTARALEVQKKLGKVAGVAKTEG
jgi:HEAT repeat protein